MGNRSLVSGCFLFAIYLSGRAARCWAGGTGGIVSDQAAANDRRGDYHHLRRLSDVGCECL